MREEAEADLEAAVLEVAQRDRNLDGVEMFLVLEDRTGASPPPRPPTAADRELARRAQAYLGRIAEDPEHPTTYEVATALEVLAAHHFAPGAPEGA